MRATRIAQTLLALAALSIYFIANITWFEVEATDELSGAKELSVAGATAYAALQVLPWAMIAGTIAAVALGPKISRVLAALVAAIAAGGLWVPIQVITKGPDIEHFQQVLTTSTTKDPAELQSWAEVESVSTQMMPVIVTAAAFAIIIVCAIFLIVRPGKNRETSSRYSTPQSRKDAITADLEQDPDSGRILWDALDADVDPTTR
ncbi:MAG: TIGR02234 family membrane protein [Corynebacterium sp.]|nr:TIGR02234 family membrane protein [Corynebacterium sp.]